MAFLLQFSYAPELTFSGIELTYSPIQWSALSNIPVAIILLLIKGNNLFRKYQFWSYQRH
jgi:hypothetical protein